MNVGPTERLARFIVETDADDVSPAAATLAAHAILDTVGVMLPGARSTIGRQIRAHVLEAGGRRQAHLFGSSTRVPAESAALANGTAGHALDYDDSSHPLHGHPSAVILPALLAVLRPFDEGDARVRLGPMPGARDILAAHLIGFEVESALARAVNLAHYRAGWHATGTLGAFGSTAAVARLLGATVDETRMAIGVAASSSSGLRANFGGFTKPLHAGTAAAAGVRAVALARQGWSASATILEDPAGWGEVYGGGVAPDWDSMVDGLGTHWTITEPAGLQLKPYPACGATHPSIDAVLSLRTRVDVASVRAVHVGTSALLPRLLVHHDPRTPEQAKFSLEYAVASALVRGHVALADFVPDALVDSEVRRVMGRVTQAVDPRVADSTEFSAIVRIELADGALLEERVELARGKNANPLSVEDRRRKLIECLGAGPTTDRLWDAGHQIADPGASFAAFMEATLAADRALDEVARG